jgi:hypothetical protein
MFINIFFLVFKKSIRTNGFKTELNFKINKYTIYFMIVTVNNNKLYIYTVNINKCKYNFLQN